MKAILLLRKLLPATLLAIGLAGCGGGNKPADDNATAQGAKPDGDGTTTPKPAEPVELAAFIKGKRVWVLVPDESAEPELEAEVKGGDPGIEREARENAPEKKDECEPPSGAGKGAADTGGEKIFFQFNEDGTVQIGRADDEAKPVAFLNEGLKYQVDKLRVNITGNEDADGHIIFGSAEPKAGDDVTLVHDNNEAEKVTTKIVKIEPADKLKVIKFEIPPPSSKPSERDPEDRELPPAKEKGVGKPKLEPEEKK